MRDHIKRSDINPALFGQRLTQAMARQRESTYSVADAVSLSAGTISRYANGKMAPKVPTLQQLADHLHVNPLWLMGCDCPMEPDPREGPAVPILRTPDELTHPGAARQSPFGPIDATADFCFRLSDGSMTGARILPGDYVFVALQSDVSDGEIAVVAAGNTFSLRRVYKIPGRTIFRTEPGQNLPENQGDLRIIGRAIAFQSKAL